MSWRESQNRLADIGLHGNTALLPKARLNNAMGGDDKAVRNGADDGESVTDLELFRQLWRYRRRSVVGLLAVRCHCAVSPRQTARTELESSAAAAVIGGKELMPCRTAQRE